MKLKSTEICIYKKISILTIIGILLISLCSCSNDEDILEQNELYGFAPIYMLHSLSLSAEELNNEVQNRLKSIGFCEKDFMYLEGKDSLAVSIQLQDVTEKLEQALSDLPKDIVGYLDIYGCKMNTGEGSSESCEAMYCWYRKNYSKILGSTETEKQITITNADNKLYVTNANGLILTIFNTTGTSVRALKVDGEEKCIDIDLPEGCYIVKVGNVIRKLYVK